MKPNCKKEVLRFLSERRYPSIRCADMHSMVMVARIQYQIGYGVCGLWQLPHAEQQQLLHCNDRQQHSTLLGDVGQCPKLPRSNRESARGH